jgi:hypothetical protein
LSTGTSAPLPMPPLRNFRAANTLSVEPMPMHACPTSSRGFVQEATLAVVVLSDDDDDDDDDALVMPKQNPQARDVVCATRAYRTNIVNCLLAGFARHAGSLSEMGRATTTRITQQQP